MNTFSEGQDIQKIEEEIRTQIFLKKSTVLSLERQNLTSFIIQPSLRVLLFSPIHQSERSLRHSNNYKHRSTLSNITQKNESTSKKNELNYNSDRKVLQLILAHNKLCSQALQHLSFFTDLCDLNLQENLLTEFPLSITFLTQLTRLTISFNQLSNLIGLHNLTKLSFLDISTNQVTCLPTTSELSRLIHLETLKANRNEISSLESLCVLTKLCSLQLNWNRISELSSSIRTLTSLTELDLSTNQIQHIPKEISSLKNLSLLNLSSNRLTSFPSELCECKRLRELILSKNFISNIPEQITQIESLQVLNLSHNEISFVPSFRGLFQLRKLNLSHNKITRIHSSLFQLVNHSLNTLDISSNEFVEFPVPQSHLTCLNKLVSFFFHFNYFVTVPSCVQVSYSWQESIPSQILDNVFLGGSCPAQNRRGLKTLGVTHIINAAYLTPDQHFPEDFTYLVLKWEDSPKQSILQDLPMCFEFIEKATQKGKVFVHCQAGVSRSPSIVIAWIMYKRRLTFEEAFTIVQRARPIVHLNIGFVNQLKEFEKQLKQLPAVKSD